MRFVWSFVNLTKCLDYNRPAVIQPDCHAAGCSAHGVCMMCLGSDNARIAKQARGPFDHAAGGRSSAGPLGEGRPVRRCSSFCTPVFRSPSILCSAFDSHIPKMSVSSKDHDISVSDHWSTKTRRPFLHTEHAVQPLWKLLCTISSTAITVQTCDSYFADMPAEIALLRRGLVYLH